MKKSHSRLKETDSKLTRNYFFCSLLERVELEREQGPVHSAAGFAQADTKFGVGQSQGNPLTSLTLASRPKD